jgi:hypothetical protein
MTRTIALAWGLLLAAGAALWQLTGAAPAASVIRRFPAAEARQAVAVDDRFFYAIGDRAIGKYDKATGRRVGGWSGDAAGPIRHLNSGVVIGRELYCAHSNYPLTPMVSSVEVFDTDQMAHLRSVPLPSGLGSATWIVRGDGAWWVTFAHYGGRGGEPGKGPEATRLVRFSPDWKREASWSFPAAVVSRWGAMSSSGGALAAGRLFYTTGHDAPELYVLEVPARGGELVLRAIVPAESEGQGIALDGRKGTLYSIQRRTGEVLESTLPNAGR